jgi:hypothetical protein
MRRAAHVVVLACVITAAAVFAYPHHTVADGTPPSPPRREADAVSKPLPLAQVVLFNNGVGYFQREGTVDGDTRIDLALPADNINDLLKSLVLQNPGEGSANAVTYDSNEPLERTLKSFSLDLTGNPTFGQILNQARGEKVELSLQGGIANTASGQIVGMESQVDGTGKEVHLLNLLGSEGLQSIPLSSVQRIRFLNPTLDAELQAALRVLMSTHDTKKKMVHLHFKGAAKRAVRVGYVVENPIWKTTYRLVLDDDGKATLQSWAVIDNTTDEDWKDVRLALVAGRPLSFTMDLYEPLYVPRPKVEPELFASLRSPAYNGALLNGNQVGVQLGALGAVGVQLGALGGGVAGAGIGGVGNQLGVQLGGFAGQFQGAANLGIAGGNLGVLNRYQSAGFQGGSAPGLNISDDGDPAIQRGRRLTYEELLQRRKAQKEAREAAKRVGSTLAAVDPKENLDEEARASVGEEFQHVFDQKMSLPRQKSALVQILNKEVQGKRVSIFNEAVHSRVPLLGLKFKNTTGKPLMQGPLMVYEAGRYAGDARILDLQPDEERLLAFAVDQGVEVKTFNRESTGPRLSVRRLQNELDVKYLLQKTRSYLFRNRSKTDRLMVIEHPADGAWALAAGSKPAERTRDLYRFETDVTAGKATKFDVAEELARTDQFREPDLTLRQDQQLVQHYGTGNTGVEIEIVTRADSAELTGMKIGGGKATIDYRQLDHQTYRIRNVSKAACEVTLEHQVPAGRKLVSDAKPIPGSTDRYLFLLKIAPGKEAEQAVRELGPTSRTLKLADLDEEQARPLLASAAVSDPAKAVLREALKQRAELEKTRKAAEEARAALKGIVDEQGRLRANLERLPSASAAYKRYLEKFDAQETQIEKLQAQINEADKAIRQQQKENSEFILSATAE